MVNRHNLPSEYVERMEKLYPPRGRRGYRLGKWIVSSTLQPPSAPFIDTCLIRDNEGRQYRGRAIRLSLRKRLVQTTAAITIGRRV